MKQFLLNNINQKQVNGLIESLIKGYHTLNTKSRMQFIEKVLGDGNFFRQEMTFFDDGKVTSEIDKMQENYRKISTEIDFVENTASPEEKNARLNFLYKRQIEILEEVAFQSSQRLEKVPACLKLLDGLKSDFTLCLQGLQKYSSGEIELAKKFFESYLAKHKNFGEHYQLNKIFGMMKLSARDYKVAKIYLQKVTQICPEDIEVHSALAKIYRQIGNTRGEIIETKILKLLEGD